MKTRTLLKLSALLLAVCLLLTGCTSVFEDLVDSMFNSGSEEDRVANSMDIVVDTPDGELSYNGEGGIVAVKPRPDEGVDGSAVTTTTTKPAAVQNGTATDAELAMFRNMKPAQLEKEYFLPALAVYGELDGLGGMECDWNVQLQKNGFTYMKVRSSQPNLNSNLDFSKYENFRKYVYTLFDKTFADGILSNELFLNNKGDLYLSDLGRGSDITYQGCSYGVTKVTKSAITVTVYARYIKGEYLDTMFDDPDFELTDDKIETQPINFTLVKQNGNWVFKTFSLWF